MKIHLKKIKKKENDVFNIEDIKKDLEQNHNCYVLITCTQPSKDGQMQVELNYSGDEALASYLVDGARDVFDCETKKVKDSVKC